MRKVRTRWAGHTHGVCAQLGPSTLRDRPGIVREHLVKAREALLPLHVNVFAGTLADLGGLAALHDAVREAGRLPWEVTVDLVPPYTHVPQRALLEAVSVLRGQGFRICARLTASRTTGRPPHAWRRWSRRRRPSTGRAGCSAAQVCPGTGCGGGRGWHPRRRGAGGREAVPGEPPPHP